MTIRPTAALLTLVMTFSAHAEDGIPAKQAETWKALTQHTWYDTAAFAGGTYAFRLEDGQPKAKHTVFGSGRPVIAEGDVPVGLSADGVLTLGAVGPGRDGKPAPPRRFRYDARARVLIDLARCGARLHPYDGLQLTPLLTELKIPQEGWLTAALTHRDRLVRREALVAYATNRGHTYRAGFPEVVPLLAKEQDPELLRYATWAAGTCQEEAAVPKLIELLGRDDDALRREAAAALGWGSLGGKPGRAALTELLKAERDPAVRDAAERSLEILNKAR